METITSVSGLLQLTYISVAWQALAGWQAVRGDETVIITLHTTLIIKSERAKAQRARISSKDDTNVRAYFILFIVLGMIKLPSYFHQGHRSRTRVIAVRGAPGFLPPNVNSCCSTCLCFYSFYFGSRVNETFTPSPHSLRCRSFLTYYEVCILPFIFCARRNMFIKNVCSQKTHKTLNDNDVSTNTTGWRN